MQENHYQALGLDLTAPNGAVRLALERLVDQARRANRDDPDRARALWNRVRAVRRDLLSGRETREAYDLSILSAMPVQPSPVPVPERYVRPERPRMAPAPVATPRRWPLVVAGTGAVLFSLIVAIALAGRLSDHAATPVHHPSISGTIATGSPFPSGKSVAMQWNPVKGATRYRLELWTSSGSSHRVVTLSLPSYRTVVTGAQEYFWRVKALVQGHWTGYGATSHFAVAAPTATRVAALTVPHASSLHPGPVTLCWKPVSKAIGYRVAVSGATPRTVHSSCTRLTLGAGRHVWKVAAMVRGVKNYLGPSKTGAFVVRRRRHAVIARATTRRRHPALVAAAHSVRGTSSTSSRAQAETVAAAVSIPVSHTLAAVPRVTRRSPTVHHASSGIKSPSRTRPPAAPKAPTGGSRPQPTRVTSRPGSPPPPPPPPPAPAGRSPAPAGHTPAPAVYAPASKTVAQPTQPGSAASSPPSFPSQPTAAPTPVTVVQPTEPPDKKTCPGKSCEAHGRGHGKNHPHP
jgi:hypothetical protein